MTHEAYQYSVVSDDVLLDWGDTDDDIGPSTDDLSSEGLDYEDRKARLIALLDAMIDGAPSWDGESAKVSVEAADTAIRFLRVLPPNRTLPYVAPDGEGDVMLVWEPPVGNSIITVEKNTLHLLDQPGTRSVEHIDNQHFSGERIPVGLLQAIPFRKTA